MCSASLKTGTTTDSRLSRRWPTSSVGGSGPEAAADGVRSGGPTWPASDSKPRPSQGPASAGGALLARGELEVGLDHEPHQLAEVDLRCPSELAARLRRVGAEEIHLRRPEVARIEAHEVLPLQPGVRERQLGELADRVALAGADHVVLGGRP